MNCIVELNDDELEFAAGGGAGKAIKEALDWLARLVTVAQVADAGSDAFYTTPNTPTPGIGGTFLGAP